MDMYIMEYKYAYEKMRGVQIESAREESKQWVLARARRILWTERLFKEKYKWVKKWVIFCPPLIDMGFP
ncbi:hypothetical protein [Christensenella tenuis]|jgi:hypothetical protein|uniref:Uncharacterized protein n=1 Tax=Christensenella tenuis TaxID=2763033 RepID=A0ABR7ECM6_9FIRM|nr:hypothetical protein [Christensenella tenuis]MBC5647527.1 hypothetical protein [Christensenella tenuis]